jgi:tRNA-specific 2-thiouridylase
VLDVQPVTNTVVVGPADRLAVDRLRAQRASWCGPAAEAGARIGVQVRAHGEEVPATVVAVTGDGDVEVALGRPLRGVAPGQTLALYDGTRVVGSATLTGTGAAAVERAGAS